MDKEGSSLLGLLGVALVMVSYFLYPEAYHQFFQWLQDGFFDALNSSFGNDAGPSGKEGGGQGGRGQQ